MEKRYTFTPKNWLRFGLAAALTVLTLNSNAQNGPVKQWDKTIGGSYDDNLYSLQQTSDGGYVLGGRSRSGISGDKSQACQGNWDYWVVKLDASGNKVWDSTFGGNNEDMFYSLQQTSDGGYILGGYSGSQMSGDKSQNGNGLFDFWVVKVDSLGKKQWDKSIGGNDYDMLYTLFQSTDGGYILGGESSSGISGDRSQVSKGRSDYWVVKLDSVGNKLWDKSFGGNSVDYLLSVQQTSDSGYILGGWSKSGISGDKSQASKGGADYWVIKLDVAGIKLWDKSFGGNSDDVFKFVQQTSDGGYILGGESWSGLSGDRSQAPIGVDDYWIVKLDSVGNKLWDKSIGGNDYDDLFSLQQTSDGGYILGGTSKSGLSGDKSQASKGGEDFWIVKLDSVGNKLWDKTIGGNSEDNFKSLQQTFDGGYILGGASFSGISSDKSQASKGGFDYWIVKLGADITGVNELISNSQILISPNPSQGKFNLQLEDITAPKVEVSISDLLGRVILQKELPVVSKQVSEELEIKAAKGMYLLQIKAGNQATSRKLVVE